MAVKKVSKPRVIKKPIINPEKAPRILKAVRSKVIPAAPKPFEETAKIHKLSLYVTIVNAGVGKVVVSLLENIGSSCSFVNVGEGTAPTEMLQVLGISSRHKEVVYSFIKNEDAPTVAKELSAFFIASKKNEGIGFNIPLTSVMGVRLYKFLSQTM